MNISLPPGGLVGLPQLPSPADHPGSPLSRAFRQPLLLGLFLPIQAGGWTQSTLPRSTDWSFDYNKALTLKAEALGLDLVFALSQWLPKGGYGGVFDGQALDSFTTIAALSALTERILLISTVHVLYGPWHPLHFAKFGATLDHITGGRWGVNVVTGHRAVEHEMFGWPRIEHDRRYELAAEFIEVVQRLWARDENFSFEGQSSWKLGEAYVSPRPNYGRPVIVNATGSEAGFGFAGRYSDIVFITSPAGSDIDSALGALPAHTAKVKAAAERQGRQVRTLLNPLVIARPTEKEAWDLAHKIAEHADRRSPRGFSSFDSDAHAWKGREGRDDPLRFVGGNIRVIGSYDQVVEQFAALKAAGVDGLQLSFFDFAEEIDRFGAELLPRLKQAGLRH